MDTSARFIRRPYVGSCTCGTIKYITYLTLPTSTEDVSTEQFYAQSGLRLYKCNCTVCQKMGIFHLRLKSPSEDFVLLSPLNPEADDSGMTKYMTPAQKSNWWFCKTCGVRCFTVRGPTEQAEMQVPVKTLQELGVEGKGCESENTAKIKAWKLQTGFVEKSGGPNYFSLNAVTLHAKQEGLDLARFHEKKWVSYVNSLEKKGSFQFGVPYAGGIY